MMRIKWLGRYGSGIHTAPGYFGLMINGRMYRFRNGGKWGFSTWDNIWRKTATPLPH